MAEGKKSYSSRQSRPKSSRRVFKGSFVNKIPLISRRVKLILSSEDKDELIKAIRNRRGKRSEEEISFTLSEAVEAKIEEMENELKAGNE
jgi:hypothetical protein